MQKNEPISNRNCNQSGLFSIDPVKGIDDKESGYDDAGERKELEKTAKMLFG